jgi:tetratricopeptide (TPR) repeat protein
MLAMAYRQLGDAEHERSTLESYVARDAAGIEGRQRLMELDAAAGDWHGVEWEAKQALAINPLIPAPHRYLALAAEKVQDRPAAIAAYRAMLLLAPLDRAEQHYRLAKLLFDENQLPAARREVDMSLEEAPRYRAAHELLLELAQKMDAQDAAPRGAPLPADIKESPQ